MNKITSVIVILALVVAGYFLFMRDEAPMAEDNNSIAVGEPNPAGGIEESKIKEFTVEAGMFYFSPKTMNVNVGDTVRITVKNVQGMHDLKIDEFNAATKILNAGEEETIEFVADKAGSFEYYCSVGTHRQMGMVGTLTVQ